MRKYGKLTEFIQFILKTGKNRDTINWTRKKITDKLGRI